MIKADNDFTPLVELLYKLPGAPMLNLTSANKHKPNIKRHIWKMILMQFSPKTIILGQTLNYKQCSLPFDTYCQVLEEEEPHNSLIAHTSGAITIWPSSNRQGGHLFLSLKMGQVISRQSWTVIPMPQLVIDQVNTMAAD